MKTCSPEPGSVVGGGASSDPEYKDVHGEADITLQISLGYARFPK
jgi:hypothetical protein